MKKPVQKKPGGTKRKPAKKPMARDEVKAILVGILNPSSVPSDSVISALHRSSGVEEIDIRHMAQLIAMELGQDGENLFLPPSPVIG